MLLDGKGGFFRGTYLMLLVLAVPPGQLLQPPGPLVLLQLRGLLLVLRLWHVVALLLLLLQPRQPQPLQATLPSLFHRRPSQAAPVLPQQPRGLLLLAYPRCRSQHSKQLLVVAVVVLDLGRLAGHLVLRRRRPWRVVVVVIVPASHWSRVLSRAAKQALSCYISW